MAPTFPGRDKSRDGFANRCELYSLTHFGWLWRLVQKHDALARWVNRKLINQAVYKVPTRPRPFSTMAEYSSWDSLTDRSWLGRHLPADPDFNRPGTLPPIDKVVDLFRMRSAADLLSPKSTVLFPYFVQWFSDGFLRVTSDAGDDKSVDRNGDDGAPGTADARARLRTTSNHQIDLSTVYGITSAATRKLRSGTGGRLKSQTINGEEYPPFYYQEPRAYPGDDVIAADLDGVYRPSLLERHQPPERKATLFATGVDRGNVHIGFVALNTLCLREHNRLCGLIAERHPDWDDERLFQTARNTLIAIVGRIVVEEASSQPAGRIGVHNTPDFLLHLERTTIAWGRETQLASYNDYREYCRFPRVTDFNQITGDAGVQRQLAGIYGHVDKIEFYPGLMAEDVRPGSALPPLVGRLIGIDAFSQVYTSPLFAEHIFNERTFSDVGWKAIQDTRTLEQLVRRNVPASGRKVRVTFQRG